VTDRKIGNNQERSEVKIFTIPLVLLEIKENIKINTKINFETSTDKQLNQAFKLHSQGNILEAAKYYQSFIDQDLKDHRVYSNYGSILKSLGKLEDAELFNRKAIAISPNLAELHYNHGNTLRDIGKLKEAETSTRKAIFINPNSAKAHCNLGAILRDLDNLHDAEVSTRKAIELYPDYALAHCNLGIIFRDLGKIKDAVISTRKAIKLYPDFASAHFNLGNLLTNLGRVKEGIKHYSLALEKEPTNVNYYIISRLRFSPVMKDIKQIDSEREKYQSQIKNLKHAKNLYYNNKDIFNTNMFYLAYQNKLDDKIILEALSNSLSKVKGVLYKGFSIKEYHSRALKRNKIKLGICSEFLRDNHTIGKLYINVITDLLKTDLEIFIYIPPKREKNSELDLIKNSGLEIIRNTFKKVIDLPQSPYKACELIYSNHLDILFYPDIGMSNYTYILALSKLALVQVTSLGHPNTSGIKNIDYFITNDIKPHHPSSSYTERLVKLSRLPFNYKTPEIIESNLTSPNLIDLDNKFIIGLTQSIFKLHPDFDTVLESIIKEIDNAYLILLKDTDKNKTEALKNRWKLKNNILLKKSIFLNRMSQDDFINTTKSFQIMLDPFYFGSGNTYYEAMAFGIPFITYPFRQRGSLVSSGYKQMGIKNPPIAATPEDYINWCKKYANNRSFLKNTKKELRERAKKYLFNDKEIYKEYYKFFNEAVSIAKRGKLLSSNWSP